MAEAVLGYADQATWESTGDHRRLMSMQRRNRWLRWVRWGAVAWAVVCFSWGMWRGDEQSRIAIEEKRSFAAGLVAIGLAVYVVTASIMAAGRWWAMVIMPGLAALLALGMFVGFTTFGEGADKFGLVVLSLCLLPAAGWFCLRRWSWPLRNNH